MSEIKSIAIISDDYPSKGRMVFVFVQQLAEALVDLGVKVSIIAPQSIVRSLVRGIKLLPKFSIYRTNHNNEYEVYRPYSLSFSTGNSFFYLLAKSYNQKRVNRCLKRIDPQIVYGHFWHNARKVLDYAVSYGKPLFVACGEGDDALDNWAASLSKAARDTIKHQIKGVISVSTENKRKCLSYGLSTENNTVVLPNCVNETVFHPIDAVEFRKKMGASESDFVISYTGAFIDRKGYNRLSEAINKLNNERIKVIFSGKPMAGYENNKPNCKGTIHCGPVDHDILPQYLCASDVFVLPTLKEGCCNAIVEALACGLPVISSDRPFNDDILNEGNSIKIDPENVDEIAEAINKMMIDNDYYLKLRNYSIKHAGDHSIVERAKEILVFISKMTNTYERK